MSGVTADIYLGGHDYLSGLKTPGLNDNWIVYTPDPADMIAAVPEPVTMAGLMLAIGCVGRYIRKRR